MNSSAVSRISKASEIGDAYIAGSASRFGVSGRDVMSSTVLGKRKRCIEEKPAQIAQIIAPSDLTGSFSELISVLTKVRDVHEEIQRYDAADPTIVRPDDREEIKRIDEQSEDLLKHWRMLAEMSNDPVEAGESEKKRRRRCAGQIQSHVYWDTIHWNSIFSASQQILRRCQIASEEKSQINNKLRLCKQSDRLEVLSNGSEKTGNGIGIMRSNRQVLLELEQRTRELSRKIGRIRDLEVQLKSKMKEVNSIKVNSSSAEQKSNEQLQLDMSTMNKLLSEVKTIKKALVVLESEKNEIKREFISNAWIGDCLKRNDEVMRVVVEKLSKEINNIGSSLMVLKQHSANLVIRGKGALKRFDRILSQNRKFAQLEGQSSCSAL